MSPQAQEREATATGAGPNGVDCVRGMAPATGVCS